MKTEAAAAAAVVDEQQIVEAEQKRARLQEHLWSLEKQVWDGPLFDITPVSTPAFPGVTCGASRPRYMTSRRGTWSKPTRGAMPSKAGARHAPHACMHDCKTGLRSCSEASIDNKR